MKAIITAYKDTGKFYDEAMVDLPNDLYPHQVERFAKIAAQHVPLLTDGFVHVRLTDEEAAKPGANFFNLLFTVSYLKSLL